MGVICEFEEEFTGRRTGREVERGAVVGDPVCVCPEKGAVVGCGANAEHAAAGGFAGARAGGGVLDDDTVRRGDADGGGTFKVRLGIGLATLDVGGGDEMSDVFPEMSDAQSDFGEGTGGGSDDSEPVGRNCSEQFFGAGERDDVGDIVDFGTLHPLIFSEMNRWLSVGQKLSNRSKTGAAMSEFDDVFGVHIVPVRPASPDAGDGRGRVDEDAVHVDQKAAAKDPRHWEPDSE